MVHGYNGGKGSDGRCLEAAVDKLPRMLARLPVRTATPIPIRCPITTLQMRLSACTLTRTPTTAPRRLPLVLLPRGVAAALVSGCELPLARDAATKLGRPRILLTCPNIPMCQTLLVVSIHSLTRLCWVSAVTSRQRRVRTFFSLDCLGRAFSMYPVGPVVAVQTLSMARPERYACSDAVLSCTRMRATYGRFRSTVQ